MLHLPQLDYLLMVVMLLSRRIDYIVCGKALARYQ
nr:MAG TPA: hypothetical protein [Caudoviricetes sp.]